MRSNYKKIGNYIQLVDERNKGLKVDTLLGLTIDKEFIPSVANTVGTNMANYKIIRQDQFACSLMQVRRDKKIPVALLRAFDEAIISQAYPVFEIADSGKLLPEYLMMWMSRSEFDREACFHAVGGVRGSLEWDDFCDMELPVPAIKKQQEIVKEYHTIVNRIKLNEQLNRKLEETAQAIYKQWFVDFEFPISAEYAAAIGRPKLAGKPYKSSGGEMVYNEELGQEIPKGWDVKVMSDVISVKDGTHDSPKATITGYPLATSTHLNPYDLSLKQAYNISQKDFDQVNKRSKVDQYDILFSMIGTVGSICFVLYDEILFAIKNVGLFKTSQNKKLAEYILCYLKSRNTKRYVETCLLGSTQNYITLTGLRNIPILLPPPQAIESFREPISTLIHEIYCRVQENILNIELQETLLGKMIKMAA